MASKIVSRQEPVKRLIKINLFFWALFVSDSEFKKSNPSWRLFSANQRLIL